MIILKILAMWTVASFALALVIGPILKDMASEQTESLTATARRFHPWQPSTAGILMAIHLAQNQFISNPSVISPRTEGSAVAVSDPSGSAAAAAPVARTRNFRHG